MAEPTAQAPLEEPAIPPKTFFADWPPDKTYLGKAVPRTGGGWKIHIVVPEPEADGNVRVRLVGMTECATLKQLEQKTWEFVRAFTDEEDVHIMAVPDIGDDLMTHVIQAWKAMKDAKEAEAQAAKRMREVVKELRARGLSVTDIAWLAHISRGRVSQLLI